MPASRCSSTLLSRVRVTNASRIVIWFWYPICSAPPLNLSRLLPVARLWNQLVLSCCNKFAHKYSNRRGAMLIPITELRDSEAKCNLLVAANEDYHHVLDCLETKYQTKVKGHLLRRVEHGGVGPLEVCLEQIAVDDREQDQSAGSWIVPD